MAKTNGRQGVIEKIQKWLEEERYQFSVVPYQYADFQADLKNPNMSVVLLRDKVDSISIETYCAFTEEDKRAYAYLKKRSRNSFGNCRNLYWKSTLNSSFFPILTS